MEVSYLKAVLRASLGTAFSEDTRSRYKPFSSGLQLQQPIQNPFPFSTALWDNENELEDPAEEVIFDEFFGNTFPPAKPGPMDDQESGAEQKIESDRYLPKPTTDPNEEIIGEAFFAQDNPLPMQKKADIDLHSTSELKMDRSDVKNGEKEVKEDKSGAQNIVNKIDIQQIEVKRVQPKENNGIPTAEVVKEHAIRVPSSDQSSSPGSVSQLAGSNLSSQELNKNQQAQQLKDPSLQRQKSPEQLQPQPRKTRIAEPQKEQIRTPSDIARQEKVHESEPLVKTEEKEVKQDHGESQNIASKIDIQQPDVMRVKPKESDRIPTIEVVKQDAIRVPSSNQLSSPSSVSQLAGSNLPSQELNKNQQSQQLKDPSLQRQKLPEQIQPQSRKSIMAEPQKEQIQVPSDIAEQKKVKESETPINVTQVIQKQSKQNLNTHFFMQTSKEGKAHIAKDKDQKQEMPEQIQPQPRKSIMAEPQKKQIRTPSDMAKQEKVHESEALAKSVKVLRKPTSQENLNAFFFTKSLKKGETQTAKIAKDIALINKKLDEHISKEQPEPVRPVFLPKRPASRNLGGWSNLERNYIR
jgi:hypothetical protein